MKRIVIIAMLVTLLTIAPEPPAESLPTPEVLTLPKTLPTPIIAPEPTPEPTKTPEKYNESEKDTIAKVVYAEARGECFDGQVAVAQTVINRYESEKFGKSIKSVAYAKNQFAVGKKYNDENMEAVEYAIENSPYPDTMYYFRVSKSKNWRNFEYCMRLGNHSFYLE